MKNYVEGFENEKDRMIFENRLLEVSDTCYYIWKISLNLALRISDTINITIEDTKKYLKDGTYFAKDTKTGKLNRIPLNANTRLALEGALELRSKAELNVDNTYLFVGQGNRAKSSMNPINRNSVYRIYKEVVDYQNLDINIGTHSGRKTWGLTVYNRTKDIAIVMDRLNHTSEKSTLVYLGITSDKIKKVADDFNL